MVMPGPAQPNKPTGPDPDRHLRTAVRQLEVLDQLDGEVDDLVLLLARATNKLSAVEHLVMGVRLTIVGDGGETR